jgi:hypothetical protein
LKFLELVYKATTNILSCGDSIPFSGSFVSWPLGVGQHGIAPLRKLSAQYRINTSWYMEICFFVEGVKQKALISQTLAILSALFGCGNVHVMC